MPTYDLRCVKCRAIEEVRVPLPPVEMTSPEDDPWHDVDWDCKQCGGTLVRQLSVPGVIFKGEGWAKKERGK